MRQFLGNSYLFGGNAPFIEDLYEQYLANPGSVAHEWREYFDSMQVLPGAADGKDVAHAPVVQSFVQRAKAGELGGRRPPSRRPTTG
jgi:2-oxoglutarate dehydrogenase E1 component